jgi:hypothetical protein
MGLLILEIDIEFECLIAVVGRSAGCGGEKTAMEQGVICLGTNDGMELLWCSEPIVSGTHVKYQVRMESLKAQCVARP